MEVKVERDWSLIAGGVLLLLLGLVFLFAPDVTLLTVALIAGIGLVAAGVLDVVSYVRSRKTVPLPAWTLLYAALDIIVGLVFLIHPIAMSAVIPWIAAICFVAFGIFSIATGVSARRNELPMWGVPLAMGILDVLCGVAFFLVPEALVAFIALFLLTRAITLIVFGTTARKLTLAL